MRLFTIPDGIINHSDRCMWLTPPFDISFRAGTFSHAFNLSVVIASPSQFTTTMSEPTELCVKAGTETIVECG